MRRYSLWFVLCATVWMASCSSQRLPVVDDDTSHRSETVAVLPFDAIAALPLEGRLATARVREELLRSGKYFVVEPGRVDKAMRTAGLEGSGCLTVACAVQIGKALDIKWVVTGSLTLQEKNKWIGSGFLVDVANGKTLRSSTVESEGGSFTFLGDAIAVMAARLADTPIPEGVVQAGKVSELEIEQEIAALSALIKTQQRSAKELQIELNKQEGEDFKRSPKSGFEMSLGLGSFGAHWSSNATSHDFSGKQASLNWNYQWVFDGPVSMVMDYRLMGNSSLDSSDLQYNSYNQATIGVAARYWIDRLWFQGGVGYYYASVSAAHNDEGCIPPACGANATGAKQGDLSGEGPGFDLGLGWEAYGGLVVGFRYDYAVLSVSGTAQNLGGAPQSDGKLIQTTMSFTLGHRWK